MSVLVAVGAACGRVGKPRSSAAVPGSDGGSAGSGDSTERGGESGETADGTGGSARGGGSSHAGSGGTGGSDVAGRTSVAGAGAAGASASSGASSAAGASAAGAASVTPPDGCALTSTHVSDVYCSAEMACDDADHLIVSCAANADGGWRCDCQNGDEQNVFEFPYATGTPTCDVSALACLHPELLTGSGPCLRMPHSDTLSCSILDTCVQQHEISGVTLTTQTQWHAECDVVATDLSKCACGETVGSTKLIKTTDFSDGCEFLSPLCKGEATPQGDWSCAPLFEESGPGYGCHSGSRCERPIELADGSPLVEVEQYNLNCRTVDGRTRCACEGVSGYEKVTLLVPVSADDIDACRITTGVCSETEPFEPVGAEDCRRSNETATPTDCTLDIDCTQSGTTAGTQVTSLTHVSVGCIHRTDGSWLCSCNDGWPAEPATLSVQAASSAEACEQSIDECPVVTPGLGQ